MARPFPWVLDEPLVYVNCGARDEGHKALLKGFPNATYVGFEPDAEECARLQAAARPGCRFFPVAAGARPERRMLHVTRNPGCCSLLEPNHTLLADFSALEGFFEVTGNAEVDVEPLDEFLPRQGITRLDALELDVQGLELDVLRGARSLIGASTLAVFCEVEFVEMYQGQALFGEIDAFLRGLGFSLFDLHRYHVRRKAWPQAPTSGQVLWAQTVYLKDRRLVDDPRRLALLGALAALTGHLDYAAEIADALSAGPSLSADEKKVIAKTRRQLDRSARSGLTGIVERLEGSALARPFGALVRGCRSVADTHTAITRRRGYVWRD